MKSLMGRAYATGKTKVYLYCGTHAASTKGRRGMSPIDHEEEVSTDDEGPKHRECTGDHDVDIVEPMFARRNLSYPLSDSQNTSRLILCYVCGVYRSQGIPIPHSGS